MPRIIHILFAFSLVFTMPAMAQSPKTNINTIRELAIIMQLGFENAEKQRQADRELMEKRFEAIEKRFEYLEKLIQANKEALEKLIQANKEALDERIDFLENLMFGIFGLAVSVVFSLAGYLVWTQNKERELAQKTTTQTIPLEEFQRLLQQVQALEQQRA